MGNHFWKYLALKFILHNLHWFCVSFTRPKLSEALLYIRNLLLFPGITYFLLCSCFLQWVFSSFLISITIASSKNQQSWDSSTWKLFSKGLIERTHERKVIIHIKVIQQSFMEESFIRIYKSYIQICQVALRKFFTKVPDRVFINLVKEFYSNLTIVGTYLR